MAARKPYPTDVSDEKWAFVAPHLTLFRLDAGQRRHDLHVILRLSQGWAAQPSAVVLDRRTAQSTPTSGARARYDCAKRRRGSKVRVAVDMLGHLLALHVTPANAQDRDQVGQLAQAVQQVTGQSVELSYVDQGNTGEAPAQAAKAHAIELEVIKRPEAKRGIVLLPRR